MVEKISLASIVTDLWASWVQQTSPLGETALDWMADGSRPKSPTLGWPLVSFSSALAVVCAYLTFVTLGSLTMRSLPGNGIKFPALTFPYNVTQVALCSYSTPWQT